MQKFKQDYERDEKVFQKRINELEEENERIQKLNNELSQEVACLRKEADHVQKLKNEYQSVLSEYYYASKNNERGAGRKPKLNDETIKIIKQHRKDGLTQNEIAKLLNLSVGLINKACNMPHAHYV